MGNPYSECSEKPVLSLIFSDEVAKFGPSNVETRCPLYYEDTRLVYFFQLSSFDVINKPTDRNVFGRPGMGLELSNLLADVLL